MTLLILLGMGAVLAFGLVVLFGPPFLPTLRPQAKAALDLLDLKPGQTLLELGSGDGRVALLAVQRGWKVVGIELNPLLVLYSRLRLWRYRRQVTILWGNYMRMPYPPADGVFAFALQRLMPALDERLEAWSRRQGKAVPLASFAFSIPGKTPEAQQSGVFMYRYRPPQTASRVHSDG